jgi:glycosyltransferase involved in cell wall biosynthesis
MHVLNVNMSVDPVSGGGTAERTVKLSKFLALDGIRSTVLTIKNGAEEPTQNSEGEGIVALPCLLDRFYMPTPNPSLVRRLIERVDIIHLMNHWTLINAWVWMTARQTAKPYVFCPAGALPVIGRSSFLKLAYNRLIGYRIARKADRCIAISGNEFEYFARYGVGEKNITIIPNGVDPDDFTYRDDTAFRQKHGIGSHPFLLYAGRLNRIKGPDLLLHAFARIRDQFEQVHLVMAGPDAGLMAPLRQLAQNLNISRRVHFIGHISGQEKSHAFHAADLLVIPSRQEAMSIVVLEAGVCGTPVVLTDKCGFDKVGEVDGGCIVKANSESIHKGISELLGHPERMKLQGENLKRFTVQHHTWKVIVKKYILLYRQILATKETHENPCDNSVLLA